MPESPAAARAIAPGATVWLLHGLWMRAPCLWPLARTLREAGFRPRLFDHASVLGDPARSIARLRDALAASAEVDPGVGLHIVAHSLGGLIALEALRAWPELPVSRVVCLGSPLRGSAVARGALGRLSGRARALLSEGVPPWQGRAAVSMVAGTVPRGLGVLAGVLQVPHDGTVAVAETRLAGLSEHCTVPASHSGLLWSAAAAARAVAFLRDGGWSPAVPAARGAL